MPTQTRNIILLAPDQAGSVLSAVDTIKNNAIAYTPYGDSPRCDDPRRQLRFNGELQELMTLNYQLGNGYRMYSPKLMRFFSPDSYDFSPFGEGEFNPYVYCKGDPINRKDRTGHASNIISNFFSRFKNSPRPDQMKRVEKILVDKYNIYSPTESRYSRTKDNGFHLNTHQMDYTITGQFIEPKGKNFIKHTTATTQDLTFNKTQKIKINYKDDTQLFEKSRITKVSTHESSHFTANLTANYINAKIQSSSKSSISFDKFIKYNKVSPGNMQSFLKNFRNK